MKLFSPHVPLIEQNKQANAVIDQLLANHQFRRRKAVKTKAGRIVIN